MPLWFYETKVGRLGIAQQEETVTAIYFPVDSPDPDLILEETPLLREAAGQLGAYFEGRLRQFTFPFLPRGTPFQLRDWQELCRVPYGETITYRELACRLGNPKSSRAVGLANARNPLPFLIPCHRVIGSNGSLTGFRGGINMKRLLLELEGAVLPAQKRPH